FVAEVYLAARTTSAARAYRSGGPRTRATSARLVPRTDRAIYRLCGDHRKDWAARGGAIRCYLQGSRWCADRVLAGPARRGPGCILGPIGSRLPPCALLYRLQASLSS